MPKQAAAEWALVNEVLGDLSSMNGVSQFELITASLCIRPARWIGIAPAAGSNADHCGEPRGLHCKRESQITQPTFVAHDFCVCVGALSSIAWLWSETRLN